MGHFSRFPSTMFMLLLSCGILFIQPARKVYPTITFLSPPPLGPHNYHSLSRIKYILYKGPGLIPMIIFSSEGNSTTFPYHIFLFSCFCFSPPSSSLVLQPSSFSFFQSLKAYQHFFLTKTYQPHCLNKLSSFHILLPE